MSNKKTPENRQQETLQPNVENHYGYGIRKDEEPFADKIPPGGNWKDLPIEDQLVYWNGKIPANGGNTNGLRRRSWDEAAGTITTAPIQKLSCQLHPGQKDWLEESKVLNHDNYPKRKLGGRREERLPTSWDEPAPTLCVGGETAEGKRSGGASAPVHPSFYENALANHDSNEKVNISPDTWKLMQEHKERNQRAGRGFGYQIADYNKPAHTLQTRQDRGTTQVIVNSRDRNPEELNSSLSSFHQNHRADLPSLYSEVPAFRSCNRGKTWNEPSLTLTGNTLSGLPWHPSKFSGMTENVRRRQKPLLDALPAINRRGLKAVSLFAGGGLMDLGAIHAGIDVIWAAEFDMNATTAYRHNIGEHIVGPRTKKEAREKKVGNIELIPIESIPDADIVIGGPPCQDYSTAGSGSGEDGDRGKLVWRYLEIVNRKRFPAFLFENVKGLTTQKHKHTFYSLVAKFEEIGYSVSWRIINAWDYGVAQTRERIFLIGRLREMKTSIVLQKLIAELKGIADTLRACQDPKEKRALIRKGDAILAKFREEHEKDGTGFKWPKSEYETTGYHPVLRDAIGDLPEPFIQNHDPKPLSSHVTQRLEAGEYATYITKHPIATMNEPSRTVTANFAKGAPKGLVMIENHREKDFFMPKSEYTFDQANRVQSMDGPCCTIPAHHNNGQPIHPTQKPRRFTVRECLRIQSVPDTYVFPETMSLSSMYRIVGNGVASRVAYHLFNALGEQMTHLH